MISEATQKLVEQAANAQHQSKEQWIENTLQKAAQHALHPDKTASDHAAIMALLRKIDNRLAALEHNPIHEGARYINDSAKAFTETARDAYQKMDAHKWLDKSYDLANQACHTVSHYCKAWWDTFNQPSEDKPKSPRRKKKTTDE